IATGSQALGEGRFHRAEEELATAREIHRGRPGLLPSAEARDLTQLDRQADLLADLLTESLEQILARAGGPDDREWQGVFVRRYKDKAVVFDADVRRDAAGQYHFSYILRTGDEVHRVAVEDLKVLAALPLERPSRLLFGGRLAAVQREPPGRW